MSEDHETQLIRSLQRITGLEELAFDQQGSLLLGEIGCAVKGSSRARAILLKALASGKVFIIEDHSSSPAVNFGQLDQGMDYEDMKARRKFQIWRVRLDFDDFREMEAPSEVRESFDAGFTLLHELLHGLGYHDAEHEGEVGECEELINRTRAELGLALRDQYFGEPVRLGSRIISVRLRFRSRPQSLKTQKTLANLFGERKPRERLHYLFFLLPAGNFSCPSLNGIVGIDCNSRR